MQSMDTRVYLKSQQTNGGRSALYFKLCCDYFFRQSTLIYEITNRFCNLIKLFKLFNFSVGFARVYIYIYINKQSNQFRNVCARSRHQAHPYRTTSG